MRRSKGDYQTGGTRLCFCFEYSVVLSPFVGVFFIWSGVTRCSWLLERIPRLEGDRNLFWSFLGIAGVLVKNG